MNTATGFASGVVVVQPIAQGLSFWQMDLTGIPGLVDRVTGYIFNIFRLGLPEALNRIAGQNLN